MPEQISPLARSDRSSLSTDNRQGPRRPVQQSGLRSGIPGNPDPVLLTISGVLLFVVLMLVIVFRTLYPGGA